MPGVFISYSHDPDAPEHGEKVAGLVAALMNEGLKVYFDQNRGDDEEGVPWPIWMEDKIEVADHVLLVCTRLYLDKVRQKVPPHVGRGVCWEANLIYNRLYLQKLNTTKFVPVVLSGADWDFIPSPLQGANTFLVESNAGFTKLYSFLTNQHRTHFPPIGTPTVVVRKSVAPLFSLQTDSVTDALDAKAQVGEAAPSLAPALSSAVTKWKLRPDVAPAPRQDIRGLDWYEECDAKHFLGRDEDSNTLIARLLSHPIVRLIGPSGVGKSSLIRAGLLPKIREFGWRACVLRPFEDPASRVPGQLTEMLLDDGSGGSVFSQPLDAARLRQELSALLTDHKIPRLLLLFDQFEDIVSPAAAPDAVDAMRLMLRELLEHAEARPSLRAIVVYRTDADARLGRLWQEISGKAEGLPYLAVEGLTENVVQQIIQKTATEQGWTVTASLPDVTRQLAAESVKLGCSGEVFPVYLQILLKQVQETGGGCLSPDVMQTLGGVAGLIGKFLEQTLAKLKARGGDWERCGLVLEALSRSTGTKSALTLENIVRETGLSRALLADMLRELIQQRLVRPIGHEMYEIQHDRLAAVVIDSMKEGDRDAKQAREYLAAKMATFVRTKAPLSKEELVYLYRHRRQIHPTQDECAMMLASMLHELVIGRSNRTSRSRSRSRPRGDYVPVAFWLHCLEPSIQMRIILQIERWADGSRHPLRIPSNWAFDFPIISLESELIELVADPVAGIRRFAAVKLGDLKSHKYLPLLGDLAKDGNNSVRGVAMKALENFQQTETISLLSDLSKSENRDVLREVVSALANFPPAEALPLLRDVAKNEKNDIGAEAVKTIAGFQQTEDLTLLRGLASDEDWQVRLAAAKALLSFQQPEDIALLRDLTKDEDSDVRTEVVLALADFRQAEDLPLLRSFARDASEVERAEVVKAVAAFQLPEDISLLRGLARDEDGSVRAEAVKALATFQQPEDIPLLRDLIYDEEENVWDEAVKALASYQQADYLPLLRDLAKEEDWRVHPALMKFFSALPQPESLLQLRDFSKDQDCRLRVSVVRILANFPHAEALPLLRDLANDDDDGVRAEVVRSIAGFEQPEGLPLLRNLARDKHERVRLAVATALAVFKQPEDILLLRDLAEEDGDVCAAAVESLALFRQADDLPLLRAFVRAMNGRRKAMVVRAIADFQQTEDLPLLRDVANDKDWDVVTEVMRALAVFELPEDLPLLRYLGRVLGRAVSVGVVKALEGLRKSAALPILLDLLTSEGDEVAWNAVELLERLCTREELEMLLNDHDQNLNTGALTALDRVLYMPDWLKLAHTRIASYEH